MNKNRHIDFSGTQRPREKLLESGAGALTTNELLQVLVGSGNSRRSVVQIASSVEKVVSTNPKQSVHDLLEIPGLGVANVCRILAAIEVGRRVHSNQHLQYLRPEKLLPLAADIMNSKKEHLLLITVNGAQEFIQKHLISVGILNSTLIHPREVFHPVIKDYAAAFFLIHNHPSGNLEPSLEDEAITANIKQASVLLGINLLDHLIVGPNAGFYSFKQQGKL